MNIYLNCTYRRSQRGFFPVMVGETGVIAADGSTGTELPRRVEEFFSYDRFKILWREYQAEGQRRNRLFPEPESGMLGVRRIKGMIGDREGVLNIAVTAEKKELSMLENAAAAMIGEQEQFFGRMFECMSIGGEYGYDLDVRRFMSYFNSKLKEVDKDALMNYPGGQMLLKLLRYSDVVLSERDMLRFAVCCEPWKSIAPYMGGGFIWQFKPNCAISQKEYEKLFT